jgi:peroxiredoxin
MSQQGKVSPDTPADFHISDPDGKAKTLEELSGEGGLVLGFMHGTYCPACLQMLNRANFYAAQLNERGVKLAWVLQDKPSSISAYKLAAQPSPRYELLADDDPSVAHHFGANPEQPETAVPRLVYIDGSQAVRFRDFVADVHAPLHIDEVIGTIDSAHKPDTRK